MSASPNFTRRDLDADRTECIHSLTAALRGRQIVSVVLNSGVILIGEIAIVSVTAASIRGRGFTARFGLEAIDRVIAENGLALYVRGGQ